MSARRVCVSLPAEVDDALRAAAAATGQPISALVAAALRATDLILAGKTCALESYLRAIGGPPAT